MCACCCSHHDIQAFLAFSTSFDRLDLSEPVAPKAADESHAATFLNASSGRSTPTESSAAALQSPQCKLDAAINSSHGVNKKSPPSSPGSAQFSREVGTTINDGRDRRNDVANEIATPFTAGATIELWSSSLRDDFHQRQRPNRSASDDNPGVDCGGGQSSWTKQNSITRHERRKVHHQPFTAETAARLWRSSLRPSHNVASDKDRKERILSSNGGCDTDMVCQIGRCDPPVLWMLRMLENTLDPAHPLSVLLHAGIK